MKLVALLRAVNVGGRTIKMDDLRQVFCDLGFVGVATHIASGNVLFDHDNANDNNAASLLEARIATALRTRFGFDVETFVRTPAQMQDIGASFINGPSQKPMVAFLKHEPTPQHTAALLNLQNEQDQFVVLGREVYWTCRVAVSASKFNNAKLERVLAQPATMRNANTVQALAKLLA